MKPSIKHGGVIWITGLSGAGKTTLAKELMNKISCKVIYLDGDELRYVLGNTLNNYDYEGRKKVAQIYSRLCQTLALQGFLVVCSTISMYHEVRQWNRENISRYFEVYLNVSEETRKNRDPKKLYKQNVEKSVTNMAGIDFAVELPENPDIVIDENVNVDESVQLILKSLGI